MTTDRGMGHVAVAELFLRFPLVAKYLVPLHEKRLRFPDAASSPIALALSSGDDQHLGELEGSLEKGERAKGFAAIFDVELGTNPHPDEKIHDIFAEWRAAELLTDWFDQVEKVSPPKVRSPPKTCDFIGERGRERTPVEVKDLGGNFKGMSPIQTELGYSSGDLSEDGSRTNAEVLGGALLARVRTAARQIKSMQDRDPTLGRGLVVLVSRRLEHSLFPATRDQALTTGLREDEFKPVRAVALTTQASNQPVLVYPGEEEGWLMGNESPSAIHEK